MNTAFLNTRCLLNKAHLASLLIFCVAYEYKLEADPVYDGEESENCIGFDLTVPTIDGEEDIRRPADSSIEERERATLEAEILADNIIQLLKSEHDWGKAPDAPYAYEAKKGLTVLYDAEYRRIRIRAKWIDWRAKS